MTSEQAKHSIANYAALKTAIANGDKQSVAELVKDKSMQPMEKGYLLDLAKLNNDKQMIELLEGIPEQD